jgi:hypothetical protein
MRIFKIFYFIIIILLSSCSKNKRINDLDLFLKKFDSTFVNHFPKKPFKIYHNLELYSIEEFPNRGAFVRRTYEVDKQNIVEIRKNYNLYKVSAKNDSLYDCYICNNNTDYSKQKKCNDLQNPPIPNFKLLKSKLGLDSKYLNSEFEIYILDSKPGVYADSIVLSKNNCDIWKHGYSKGIIINDTRGLVSYWIEIW